MDSGPRLAGLVFRGPRAGRPRFTTSYERAAGSGDVRFLRVGTPQRAARRMDGGVGLSQLEGCVGRLAPLLARGCLVVGKSTVSAGAARRVPVTG